MSGKVYDALVIGGGTAGLVSAIYLQRSALSCAVLEAEGFGGRIYPSPTIDNYPAMPGVSGADYSEKLREQAESLGAELLLESALELFKSGRLWRVLATGREFLAKTIIYAAGEKHRSLGVPGEQEHFGRGVAVCAACDGAFFRGKKTAVVGGGDKALDDALLLSRLCTKVHLIHRRSEFRAAGGSVAKIKETKNITLHTNRLVKSIDGDERVNSICICGPEGEDEKTLAVSGVFVAIGSIPQTGLVSGLVELNSGGYVVASEDCKTSVPGLFVAGDVRAKPVRQLVTAAADGATAALSAAEYIMHTKF